MVEVGVGTAGATIDATSGIEVQLSAVVEQQTETFYPRGVESSTEDLPARSARLRNRHGLTSPFCTWHALEARETARTPDVGPHSLLARHETVHQTQGHPRALAHGT